MTNNNPTPLTFWHYLFLALITYTAFFYGITHLPLANNNDAIYAEIAREMAITGNYHFPQLNFVPYLEKPPLLYWLIALSDHLFGVTAFSARLVTASAGALTIVALLLFGNIINRRYEAWLASVMLATSLGFVFISHSVFFDILLTSELTFIFCFFYSWQETNKISYLRLAYFFLALTVLTKGFLSLILVPVISITFLLLSHQKQKIKTLFDLWGIGLFLLIALPWHVIASIKNQGFAFEYFINEQVFRFLNLRIPHDYYQGPIYYYLPRILIYIFPWSLLIPVLFKRNKKDNLSLFLWLWLLIPLVFFSISQAKANYYMVISMPALLFLLADKLKIGFVKSRTYLALMSAIALIILFSILPMLSDQYTESSIIRYFKAAQKNQPTAEIYYYKNYGKQSSILFYLQKRMKMVDADDADLIIGQRLVNASDWFISLKKFEMEANSHPTYLALTKKNLAEFKAKAKGLLFDIVSESREGFLLHIHK